MRVILLFVCFLVMACYTLPVNEVINGLAITSVCDLEEGLLKESKKENSKEIIVCTDFSELSSIFNSNKHNAFTFNSSQFLHQVESPPPDFN